MTSRPLQWCNEVRRGGGCATHSAWSRGRGSSRWACPALSCTCRAPPRTPAPPLGSPPTLPPLSSPPSRSCPPSPAPCPGLAPSPRLRFSCWGCWPCAWPTGLFSHWVPFYSWVWPAGKERESRWCYFRWKIKAQHYAKFTIQMFPKSPAMRTSPNAC